MNSQSDEHSGKPPQTDDQLWTRLRESIERLADLGRKNSDPEALAERLSARAKLLRAQTRAPEISEAPLNFLALSKGPGRYGILLEDVVEVQTLEHFSPVPGTPPFIPGVIHWRGAILSLLDPGKLLEIPETGLADLHVCVVVEAARRRIAVVAGEAEEIFAAAKHEVKPAPQRSANVPPQWILGVHNNTRLILQMNQILQDAKLVNWRQ